MAALFKRPGQGEGAPAKAAKAPKGKGAKGKGPKGLRGRVPTKRSINLVVVDEHKISIPKAALGIILIVALAGVFSKYLVYDRIVAVDAAAAKVKRLQGNLDEAMTLVNSFGDVETDYAHYTVDGMTQSELSLVDRVDVLDLVGTMLPEQPEAGDLEDEDDLDDDDWGDWDDWDDEDEDEDDEGSRHVRSWSVSENVLTVEVSGPSLEALNLLGKQLEESPIVNSCTITTANMGTGKGGGEVWAKLIVYLQQPAEEVAAP